MARLRLNHRGDIAILFSIGVSGVMLGFIAILQISASQRARLSLSHYLALDSYLSSEVYAWRGYLANKTKGAGFEISTDSKSSKSVGNAAIFCGNRLGTEVCLSAKEPDGTTGGAWEQVNTSGAPAAGNGGYQSVWTGKKLIVWNGMKNAGGVFDPATNTWKAMKPAPLLHMRPRIVWAGDQMFAFGYIYPDTYFSDPDISKFYNYPTGCYAYSYHPEKDEWKVLQRPLAVGAYYEDKICRYPASDPIWNGSKVLTVVTEVSWGITTNSIWAYDFSSNLWRESSAPSDLPPAFGFPAANKVVFYSGCVYQGPGSIVKKGLVYDPGSGSWTPMSLTNAPGCGSDGRVILSTGSKVIYWMGTEGGIYDPTTDSWERMNAAKAPQRRSGMVSVWTGEKMIVWGGGGDCTNSNSCGTGGIYDPSKKTWTATKNDHAPKATYMSSAAWVTNRALVWGGSYLTLNSAGQYYYAQSSDTYYYYPNGK